MIITRAVISTINSLFVSVLFVLVLYTISFSAVTAEESEQQLACPIEAFPSITLASERDITISNESLLSVITLTNQTDYSLGGVRVGVALFEVGEPTPKYWTVLPEEHQLFRRATVNIPLELDVSRVALGQYEMKLVAVQGDEIAVLGALVHEHTPTSRTVLLRKQTNSVSEVDMSIVLEEVEIGRNGITLSSTEPFTIKTVIDNPSTVPLFGSRAVMVVAEGFVPLGAAVRAEKESRVEIMPATRQAIFLRNVRGGAGVHTVYAGLITDGVFQPVVKAAVTLPGQNEGYWSYISRVGLSEYPLSTNTEIVACVDEIGDELGANDFHEELGLAFTVRNQNQVLAQQTLYSGDATTKGFVSYKPGVEATNLIVTTDLLQLRYSTYIPPKEGEPDFLQTVRDQLIPVETVTQTFVCSATRGCGSDALTAAHSRTLDTSTTTHPFWFYGGIVIAASLLMYLMLRRLPGGKVEESMTSKELSSGELQ